MIPWNVPQSRQEIFSRRMSADADEGINGAGFTVVELLSRGLLY